MYVHRKVILDSKRLNILISDNQKTLELLFNEYKEGLKGQQLFT